MSLKINFFVLHLDFFSRKSWYIGEEQGTFPPTH
jgi:hypothetical protein